MKRSTGLPENIAAEPPQLAYEQLMRFNQHCVAAIELIHEFTNRRMLARKEGRYYRAMLQEVRACVSQAVIEHIDQRELSIAAAASRERLNLEKQLLK